MKTNARLNSLKNNISKVRHKPGEYGTILVKATVDSITNKSKGNQFLDRVKGQLWMMQTRTTTRTDRKLIVVATVDKIIEDALRTQFTNLGHEVRFVRKGVNVLLEVLENNIDILILDVDLAGIVGMEILPIIRKMRPRLPIILITEDYTHRVRKIIAEQGITYQTFKPMTVAEAGLIRSATEKILNKTRIVEFALSD